MPSILFIIDNSGYSRSADVTPNRLQLQKGLISILANKFVNISENYKIAACELKSGRLISSLPYTNNESVILEAVNAVSYAESPITGLTNSKTQTFELLDFIKLTSLICNKSITNSEDNKVVFFICRDLQVEDQENTKILNQLAELQRSFDNTLVVNFGNAHLVAKNEQLLERLFVNKRINIKSFNMSNCEGDKKSNELDLENEVYNFLEIPFDTNNVGMEDNYTMVNEDDDPELYAAIQKSLLER